MKACNPNIIYRLINRTFWAINYYILSPLLILGITHTSKSQELFPYSEAATTLGKGNSAYRISNEYYRDVQNNGKFWYSLRFMYGIHPKLTMQLSGSISNHHVRNFPRGYANYFLNHHSQYSSINPYSLEGFHLMFKHRIVTIDNFRKHFRVATYFEGSTSNRAHDEAEPTLMGDNAGLGAGIIATTLINKFAFSLTGGYVYPFSFYDKKSSVKFRSGNMWQINLALGYILFPVRYKSYQDLNINLYAEFLYRDYQKATLQQFDNVFDLSNFTVAEPFTYNSLQANRYIDLRTSVQFIFNSLSRLDFGVEWKLWKMSYIHSYPLISIGYQRNIFKK